MNANYWNTVNEGGEGYVKRAPVARSHVEIECDLMDAVDALESAKINAAYKNGEDGTAHKVERLTAKIAALRAELNPEAATTPAAPAVAPALPVAAVDNSNMTEAQARAIVGNDAVEKVLSENCEPTGRVGFNGSCQGDELIEWSASVDSDGRDCRLEARYYTSRDQEQSVIDGGDWSNIDWVVDHFRIC